MVWKVPVLMLTRGAVPVAVVLVVVQGKVCKRRSKWEEKGGGSATAKEKPRGNATCGVRPER